MVWYIQQHSRIEDPVVDVAVRIVGRVGGLGPQRLHLAEQALLGVLRTLLDLLTLGA